MVDHDGSDAPAQVRPRPGRAIGIDLGEKRIGVAISDSGRVLAQPHTVISRSGSTSKDHAAIAALVDEYEATVVVVGHPLSLSGARGAAANKANLETSTLAEVLSVPVVLVDERLSTVEATRRLREADTRTKRSPTTKKRPIVDDLAAAVFLQSWIDGGAVVDGRSR